ncbi:MAG: dephospho-CoA kinase [Deltaproteobacteria bacterium]|jgi:dephospho-CoA kinase|nr:dephospho-CoA kinase [Deltaproteobacteria bacterium]MBT6435925.1 dephospho-CoA kinase [Deltaproteobacteria bacterium]MBT6492017.1 dephospho-CoA kinase [Deltaproteobacteria bacterium]
MKMIGLTGGIASGKSTVTAIIRAKDIPVIDADALYHGLISPQDNQPSELALKINDAFPGVLLGDGNVNRSLLGSKVFGHPEELKKLSAITHPAVGTAFMFKVQELQEAGTALAMYDVPLLYERGMETMLAGVLVVWVPRAIQLERLMEREQIELADAEKRLASQLSLDDKKSRANWVIDNSGSRDATKKQVLEWLSDQA